MIERTVIAPRLTLDIAAPAAVPAPAVIVIHEWWGVNDDIRGICERFAEAGFFAVAPDLFHGETATDNAGAFALMNKLDTGEALRELDAVVAHLAADPRVGRIGITGFCLGGAIALAAASNVSGLAAVAPFYGVPKPQWIEPSRVTAPVQGHYGARDASIPTDKPRQVFASLSEAGADVELCLYDAGHAFMRRTGDNYDEAAATAAWSRVLAFFRRHLA